MASYSISKQNLIATDLWDLTTDMPLAEANRIREAQRRDRKMAEARAAWLRHTYGKVDDTGGEQ